MTQATYTRDGETEFELVYEIPADADDDLTVWLESEDDKVGVDLAEFKSEWDGCDYEFYLAQQQGASERYRNERVKNGYGLN